MRAFLHTRPGTVESRGAAPQSRPHGRRSTAPATAQSTLGGLPRSWVDQASPLAERTGDSHRLGLMFGPTNIRLWQISMEVDGGEPDRGACRRRCREADP